MKYTLVLAVIFTITQSGISCAQSKGGKLLTRAESSFDRGNTKKAIKLVTRAEKSGFGFCAVTTAYEDLALLKAKIKAEAGDFYAAGNEVANARIIWNPSKMDSLQFYYYSLQLGEERLKIVIDSCLEEMAKDQNIYTRVAFDSIYFTIPEFGSQPIKIASYPIMLSMQELEGEMKIGDRFLIAVKEQEFYLQLL